MNLEGRHGNLFARSWWVLALRGAFGILFGALALMWRGRSSDAPLIFSVPFPSCFLKQTRNFARRLPSYSLQGFFPYGS